ncbi:hypothetical protein DM45_3911 [Burkholderia mallei]|nr:hypothetical protein DM45_3911 [Burkholderia mallei]
MHRLPGGPARERAGPAACGPVRRIESQPESVVAQASPGLPHAPRGGVARATAHPE